MYSGCVHGIKKQILILGHDAEMEIYLLKCEYQKAIVIHQTIVE